MMVTSRPPYFYFRCRSGPLTLLTLVHYSNIEVDTCRCEAEGMKN